MRFADLSGIETIDVDVDTVVETVQWHRRLTPPANEFKVAVHVPFGMTASLAQIYRLLTEADPLFDIQSFHSVEECAEYLQIDSSLLT